MDFLSEGAEAKIYKINKTTLKKIRTPKKYRLPQIDEKLRNTRNKREFKILEKLYQNKINVPKPIKLIQTKTQTAFTFEYLHANPLKQTLTKTTLFKALDQITKIHNLDTTHGDLTTLNMLQKNNQIYIIDFGLAQNTQSAEDKAVDLNLFLTCIKNEHPNLFKHKPKLLKTYKKQTKDSKKILEKLEKLELRGRNKQKQNKKQNKIFEKITKILKKILKK